MEASRILTNRCVMDEKTLRRTYARIVRRTLAIFCGGAGLMMAIALLLIVLFRTVTPLSMVLLLGSVVYLTAGLRMPRKQARRQIRRYEQTGPSAPEVTVWFDEEELTGRREGSEELTHISYDSMKSILPDGNRIILWTEQKQYIVLDTARFENGTEADFWKLMIEKCLDAVPRKYRG